MTTTEHRHWVPVPKTLGERIKATRHQLGLTQTEFAHELGVPSATLSTWERGAIPRNVDQLELTRRITDTFGVDLDWLRDGAARSSPFALAS